MLVDFLLRAIASHVAGGITHRAERCRVLMEEEALSGQSADIWSGPPQEKHVDFH